MIGVGRASVASNWERCSLHPCISPEMVFDDGHYNVVDGLGERERELANCWGDRVCDVRVVNLAAFSIASNFCLRCVLAFCVSSNWV